MAKAHRPASVPTCMTPSSPAHALNQTRPSSTMLTVAMGTPKMRAASTAIRSNAPSGGVSKMS